MGNRRSEIEWEAHKFPRESALQAYVMKRLKQIEGGHFFKIADKFTSGISDIIGIYAGRFIAIELKVGYNKPTALQSLFIAVINKCGGVAGVAWNWGEVKSILFKAGVPPGHVQET